MPEPHPRRHLMGPLLRITGLVFPSWAWLLVLVGCGSPRPDGTATHPEEQDGPALAFACRLPKAGDRLETWTEVESRPPSRQPPASGKLVRIHGSRQEVLDVQGRTVTRLRVQFMDPAGPGPAPGAPPEALNTTEGTYLVQWKGAQEPPEILDPGGAPIAAGDGTGGRRELLRMVMARQDVAPHDLNSALHGYRPRPGRVPAALAKTLVSWTLGSWEPETPFLGETCDVKELIHEAHGRTVVFSFRRSLAPKSGNTQARRWYELRFRLNDCALLSVARYDEALRDGRSEGTIIVRHVIGRP